MADLHGKHWRILVGDNRARLRELPERSVHCCVTSPPYFALRSYLPSDHPDKSLEIGSESNADAFIQTMVDVFRGVRRVLRDDGLLFLNLGDSYAQSGMGGNPAESPHRKQATNVGSLRPGRKAEEGMEGHILNIPHRVAEALRADGWIWRQTIVWKKVSPMPESIQGWKWVRCRIKIAPATNHDSGKNAEHIDRRKVGFNARWDNADEHATKYELCPGCDKCAANGGWVLRKGMGRCTTSHEYIFLMSKSDAYFWDTWGSKEPTTGNAHSRGKGTTPKSANGTQGVERNNNGFSAAVRHVVLRRNIRSVWTIASESTKEKHFATFPSELVRLCLVCGVSAGGCCGTCGAPWAPMIESERVPTRPGTNSKVGRRDDMIAAAVRPDKPSQPNIVGNRDPQRHNTQTNCIGYRQTCGCPAHSPARSVVLDPFSGLATVGQTAVFLGHDYIGLDINQEYADLAAKRIVKPPRWHLRQVAANGKKIVVPAANQLTLL